MAKKHAPLDTDALFAATEPLVRSFTQRLVLLMAAQAAEVRARALAIAEQHLRAELEARDAEEDAPPPRPRSKRGKGGRARLPRAARGQARAAAPVDARAVAPRGPDRGARAANARTRGGGTGKPACSRCGKPGHNARTCGRESSSDDAEEEREPVQVAAPNYEVIAIPPPTRATPAIAPPASPGSKPPRELAAGGDPAWLADVRRRLSPQSDLPKGHEPLRAAPPSATSSGKAGVMTPSASTVSARADVCGRLAQSSAAGDPGPARAASAPSNSSPTRDAHGPPRRRRRRREEPRGLTIAEKANQHVAASFVERMLGLEAGGVLMSDEMAELEAQRPKTRGDCLPGGINAQRPCPWLSCKYHLAIDITPSGSLQLIREKRLEELEDTCVLDVAERAEAQPLEPDELGRFKNYRFAMTLDEVGQTLNVTRERIRQIETKALMGAKASARYYGLGEADAEFDHPTYGEENLR